MPYGPVEKSLASDNFSSGLCLALVALNPEDMRQACNDQTACSGPGVQHAAGLERAQSIQSIRPKGTLERNPNTSPLTQVPGDFTLPVYGLKCISRGPCHALVMAIGIVSQVQLIRTPSRAVHRKYERGRLDHLRLRASLADGSLNEAKEVGQVRTYTE
jgi:hypothetical protein